MKLQEFNELNGWEMGRLPSGCKAAPRAGRNTFFVAKAAATFPE